MVLRSRLSASVVAHKVLDAVAMSLLDQRYLVVLAHVLLAKLTGASSLEGQSSCSACSSSRHGSARFDKVFKI